MSEVKTTAQARKILDRSLSDLCADFNADRLTPILESDITGYLYHRTIANGCPLNQLYLATRISGGIAPRRRPDIVIGTLNRNEACVDPLLIAELKVFQRWGHSDQQMRHRFSGLVAEDLPSLEEFAPVLPQGRVEIVVDLFVSPQRRGYLTGTRDGQIREEIIRAKCRDLSVEFVWLHPEAKSDNVVYESFT